MAQFYNLYPEDLPLPITPATLEERSGRWKVILGNSEWSASGLYNFVCKEGRVYVRKACHTFHGVPIGHIDLANGEPVEYAGQMQFSGRKRRGILRYWNNSSGHYRPSASAAGQASLPLELFRPILAE